MTAHEIVGRGDELDAVDRFLDRSAGAAGALVFDGGPGIGKTTVWREAAGRAAARGGTVLSCRPVAAEAKLAFASLADLFEPVADALLPELPEPQRQALAVALVRATPARAPSPRAVAAAVSTVLRCLACTGPVVLAVDDQQWLDHASAAALAFALRRIGDAPVLVISAARLDDDRPDAMGLHAAFGERLIRLRLGPLSASALHHVIRSRLGLVVPRPTLRRIAETSAGNPFFALELARALMDAPHAPGPGEPLPMPATLARLMAGRLARLSAPTLHLLLFAAASASPTVALLRAAVGTDAADDGLDRASQADVVEVDDGRVRFTHPLLAAAVNGSVGLAARHDVHARLADLVVTPEERARHLALATTHADAAVAASLEAAAMLARRRGAPDAAADLQEQAVRLTPTDDVTARHRRLIDAAEYLFQAGHLAQARAVLGEVLAETPAGPTRAAALHVLARIHVQEGSFGEACAHLEEALAQCADDGRTRVEIAIDLAFASYSMADPSRAMSLMRQARDEAERVGDDALLSRALALLVLGEHVEGLGTDHARLERALALEDPGAPGGQVMLRATAVAGLMAVEEGRLQEADSLLRATCARAADHGEESGLLLVLSYLSFAAWWGGDFAAALAWADDLALSAQIDGEMGRLLAAIHRGRARATAGDLRAAQADLAEARALAGRMQYPPGLMLLCSSELMLALLLGDVRPVEATLDPIVTVTQYGGLSPFTVQALGDVIEATIDLGDPSRAAALLEPFAERARRLDRPWARGIAARCASLLASASADLDGAVREAETAVRCCEPLGMPIDLGRALLALGQVRRRRGERRLAREALARANACFRDTGALAWAERAAAELRRIPVRRRGGDDLTPTEAQVATLAAGGKTNREVAKALFMGAKTVEANLSRIYGKLGIHSRAELGARMAAKK